MKVWHLFALMIAWPISTVSLHSQQPASVPKLFEELQSEELTDQAVEQFLKLGSNNSEVKEYLNKQLPALISQEPKGHPQAWVNEVRLAGEFRITVAIPALARWVGLPVGTPGGSTLTQRVNLAGFPAGKALVQIGEPAVPALTAILNNENFRERWVAYRALYLIGSREAITALREHINRETDPSIKGEIERALKVRH